jgi:hypothetical protein
MNEPRELPRDARNRDTPGLMATTGDARPFVPSLHPAVDRLAAVLVIAGAIATVTLLAATEPDPRGHGTHEQLGLMPCSWPGRFGMPCPTCGVTTAASHLVHFAPIDAFTTQPFGAALAASGILLAILALHDLLRGRPYLDRLARLPLVGITIGAVATFLLAWLYTTLTFTP